MPFKCDICGKDEPEHIWRCDEHYRCDSCGTKENLCFGRGLFCRACAKERAEKDVAEFAESGKDTSYTDEITCPWCGNEQSDSWEASDSGEHTCDNCERDYTHERNVQVDYSTEKCEIPTERDAI